MTSKLFKALFSFNGLGSEGSLPFEQDSLLTVIQPVDQNWYFGCLNDAYGFIPIKYVEEVQDKDYNYMEMTINACIKRLQAIPNKKLTKDEQSALKKLLKHRDSLAAEMAEQRQRQRQEQQQQQQEPSRSKRRPAPPLPSHATSAAASAAPAPTSSSCSPAGPSAPRSSVAAAALSRQLVDSVRAITAAPHASCVQAVRAVLAALEEAAATTTTIGQVLRHLDGATAKAADLDETDAIDAGGSDLSDSPDWKALDRLLASADKRRRDWQERGGWSLHESESAALTELAQLADLLAKADSRVSRRRLRADGCAGPLCLAELHAAERRPRVRAALRRCLATACAMDAAVMEALLGHSSLATDLMTEREIGLMPGALKLLAGMFVASAGRGVRLPGPVVDALNERLFVRLFSLLAEFKDSNDQDSLNDDVDNDDIDAATGNGHLAQAIVTFALAANSISHGHDVEEENEEEEATTACRPHERPLFRALLATRSAAQAFTETILLMFNRAEDPTALFEHSPPRCDSALKMLTDMFSHESTAELFYSNDIRVLVDVICRELNNASSDSPRLPPLLLLLKRSAHTVASRHAFARNGELRQALRHLSEHDDSAPAGVRSACKEILQLLFTNGGSRIGSY